MAICVLLFNQQLGDLLWEQKLAPYTGIVWPVYPAYLIYARHKMQDPCYVYISITHESNFCKAIRSYDVVPVRETNSWIWFHELLQDSTDSFYPYLLISLTGTDGISKICATGKVCATAVITAIKYTSHQKKARRWTWEVIPLTSPERYLLDIYTESHPCNQQHPANNHSGIKKPTLFGKHERVYSEDFPFCLKILYYKMSCNLIWLAIYRYVKLINTKYMTRRLWLLWAFGCKCKHMVWKPCRPYVYFQWARVVDEISYWSFCAPESIKVKSHNFAWTCF